jgi:hypothetical protein
VNEVELGLGSCPKHLADINRCGSTQDFDHGDFITRKSDQNRRSAMGLGQAFLNRGQKTVTRSLSNGRISKAVLKVEGDPGLCSLLVLSGHSDERLFT